MYSPFKMKGKSPMMKALIGKQGNLPAELQAKIKASPAKKDTKKFTIKKDPNKSYTKKDPNKSYMKPGESEFGLYKGNTITKPLLTESNKSADQAVDNTAAGIGAVAASATVGGATMAAGSAGVLGAGIVAGEGVRRMKAGTTGAKERPATKFSNDKTWSEAKKSKTPEKNQGFNFNKGKTETSPTKMKKKSPAKMKKASPAKSPGLKEKLAAQREKRAKGMKSGKVSLRGLNAKIQKAAGNVSRVIKGKNKDGTSKGGLVIKSKKNETTGKRSTTITRKNNTDKKLSKNNTNTNTNTNSNTKTKKGFDYSNATSVNALVKVRNKWKRENPGIKFPGQSEINKRLKKNPGVYN